MTRTTRRLGREKRTVDVMIGMYCRAHHQAPDGVCEECIALERYASGQVDRCPFGNDKPTCLNCAVHCYEDSKRERIREVMRFSGPRMLLRHPYLSVMHLMDGRRRSDRLT